MKHDKKEKPVQSKGVEARSKNSWQKGVPKNEAKMKALRVTALLQNTVCLQMNGAVSKVNKKCISHLTQAQHMPSAAATVQVSHALPAVHFSCLLRGCGVSFQDGATAGKGFLCAPF